MSERDDDTADLLRDNSFASSFFAEPILEFKVEFGAATHRGNIRPNNEDHYVVVKRRRMNEVLLTNLSPEELVLTNDTAYGLVVADGIGGASFGEIASGLVIQRMFELVRMATSWVMNIKDLESQQIRERVNAYVHEIQATLRTYMAANPTLKGMGTTWTSAHLFLPRALVVHIGDSRAYLLSNGELHQVTRDHTMAQAFIDSGMEPTTVKRFRSYLLNSFGGETNEVSADIYQLEMQPGDRLLLCTDGLNDMVSDDAIAAILQQASSPQNACDQLVLEALEKGGKDNVTVIVAAVAPT